jgi:hypothetical protein
MCACARARARECVYLYNNFFTIRPITMCACARVRARVYLYNNLFVIEFCWHICVRESFHIVSSNVNIVKVVQTYNYLFSEIE